jgi:hypothetical protein
MNAANEFFVLDSSEVGGEEFKLAGARFFQAKPVNRGDAPRCPSCSRFTGALAWLPPYRAELECFGGRYPDVVFGGTPGILVSELFKHAYRQSGLRGINEFQPAEIVRITRRRKMEQKPKSYHVVEKEPPTVAVDFDSSVIETDGPICPECRLANGLRAVRGFVIDLNTWDGQDLFWVKGIASSIVVSAKFALVTEKQGLVGFSLVPVNEYVLDYGLGRVPRS